MFLVPRLFLFVYTTYYKIVVGKLMIPRRSLRFMKPTIVFALQGNLIVILAVRCLNICLLENERVEKHREDKSVV